jgi:hypothetical protein
MTKDWDSVEAEIKDLSWTQKKRLDEVKKIMESRGFKASWVMHHGNFGGNSVLARTNVTSGRERTEWSSPSGVLQEEVIVVRGRKPSVKGKMRKKRTTMMMLKETKAIQLWAELHMIEGPKTLLSHGTRRT